MADIKPNHTLYINNLNEKVKKEGNLSLLILITLSRPLIFVNLPMFCAVRHEYIFGCNTIYG